MPKSTKRVASKRTTGTPHRKWHAMQTGDDGNPEMAHEVHHHPWQTSSDDYYLCPADNAHYTYPGHSDERLCIQCGAALDLVAIPKLDCESCLGTGVKRKEGYGHPEPCGMCAGSGFIPDYIVRAITSGAGKGE